MAKIYITEDDSTPEVTATFTDENDNPVDLSGASVNFRMVEPRGGGNVLDKACTITDAANGKVKYDWDAEDTSEYGRYRAEFVVNYNDGEVETFPNSSYHTVIIKRNAEV